MNEYSLKLKAYIVTIITLAFTVTIVNSFSLHLDKKTFLGILFFILVSIVSESIAIALPKAGYISVTFAIDYAALIIFGANWASWIIIIGTLLNRKHGLGKQNLYRTLFNSAQAALSIIAAGVIYNLIGGQPAYTIVREINFVPLIAGALTYFVVNATTVTIVLFLADQYPLSVWFSNIRWAIPNLFALLPIVILMLYAYEHFYIWGVALLFVPLLIARYSFRLYLDMKEILADTIIALTSAIDAKDKYTRGHSERVANFTKAIAKHIKFNEDTDKLQLMALLHDIGKVGISNKILNKDGRLTAEEFTEIKEHSLIGANIVKEIKYFGDSYEYIKYHHEKFNGGGYPDGIKGEDIPLGARIIAVADAFDAMTSDRPYRCGISWRKAIDELQKYSGEQHDPKVVEAFIKAFEEGLDNSSLDQNMLLETAAAKD